MELLEWDARTYDSLDLPHKRWGSGVLERLARRGDETVLELGCGSGRDTEKLLASLPHGRVLALDGSRQMLEQLRLRVGDGEGRLRILHCDLRDPLAIEDSSLDAAMSVATLHWLPDHGHIFSELARVLRPGGRVAFDAGGYGNTRGFLRAVADLRGETGAEVWNFADIPDTREHLHAAGFRDLAVRLVMDEARFEERSQLEAFVATVMLGSQLRDLPPQQRAPLVRAVCDRLPEPVVDYVRLQIEATLSTKVQNL